LKRLSGLKILSRCVCTWKASDIRVLSVTEIVGHGKQRGVTHQWRGTQYKTPFLPKIKVELVVSDKLVDKLIEGILDVCASGKVGDGKIFVYKVDDAVRISTKETGEKAID